MQIINKLFKTFGCPVMVYSQTSPPYASQSFGFMQPLRYKNKMYVDTQMTDLGLDDDGRYVYIGLPEPLLTARADNCRSLEMGQQKFSVIRAENVFHMGKAIYVWAIIKKDRGGANV